MKQSGSASASAALCVMLWGPPACSDKLLAEKNADFVHSVTQVENVQHTSVVSLPLMDGDVI